MTRITLAEAIKDLAGIIRRSPAGETILIVEGNEVVARLEAVKRPKLPRKPGSMKGKMTVPAKLMEPLTDHEIEQIWGKDNI